MTALEQAVWSAAFAASIQTSRGHGRGAEDTEFRAFADAWQAVNIMRMGAAIGREVPK